MLTDGGMPAAIDEFGITIDLISSHGLVEDMQDVLIGYNVTNFKNNLLELQLNFTDPYLVSVLSDYDVLSIKFKETRAFYLIRQRLEQWNKITQFSLIFHPKFRKIKFCKQSWIMLRFLRIQ